MDKRYEEALERARAGKPIDEVFPELKESEDEKIRKELWEYFHQLALRSVGFSPSSTIDDILALLERLKGHFREDTKKMEQQPAEWSEGDENALVYFHELISFGYTERFCDAQTAEDMRTWLNRRLKSHRPLPSWKPSKEQMNDLWRVATMNKVTCPTLSSLYNDLQKLL